VHSPQYSDEVEKESARCRLSLKFDCSLGLTKRGRSKNIQPKPEFVRLERRGAHARCDKEGVRAVKMMLNRFHDPSETTIYTMKRKTMVKWLNAGRPRLFGAKNRVERLTDRRNASTSSRVV
jgi:hypothetical protein